MISAISDSAAPVLAADFVAQAEDLLTPPLIYVPIRHHSPACAIHIRDLIREVQPWAVLVEGPPSFDDQIAFLVDPDAIMPLAVYSHVARTLPQAPELTGLDEALGSDPAEPIRIGSYFPVCDFSPELVALREGKAVGANLGFVDLDYRVATHFAPLQTPAGSTNEWHYSFSAALAELARTTGCRDHNELWDHLVEARPLSRVDAVAAMMSYGALARFGATEESLAADGSTAREAAMADLVVERFRDRETEGSAAPIVVVTGAFHTQVLPQLVRDRLDGSNASGSAEPAIEQPDADRPPPVESGHGLIRYSFDRLDELSGYGAGMPSPRWYQEVWAARTGTAASVADGMAHGIADDRVDPANSAVAATVIADVARELRDANRDGQPSLPSVVDALTAAQLLANLRGRRQPSRSDTVDAMVSCFTKGEDSPVNQVRRTAAIRMTGFQLGRVPPGTPRVPLAVDFDRQLADLGLPNDTSEPKRIHLDVYRSERDRRKSRFLHGLAGLNVSYGRCISPLRFSRAGGRDLIREQWTIELSGATDASLTEASMWGSSLSEAVRNLTTDQLRKLLKDQPGSLELMRFVMTAAQRGAASSVTLTLGELRQRIGVDPELTEVVGALTEAELIWTAREPLGGGALNGLVDVAQQLYVRACHLGGRVGDAPVEAHRSLVTALETLYRVLSTDAWEGLDPALFWGMLADIRQIQPGGMLRGAVAGLEWRGSRMPDDALVALLRGHVDPSSDRTAGAAFLIGLVQVAREVLWEVDDVVATLSRAFEAYDGRDFLRRVPGLRSAFATLTPRQTDRVAESIAQRFGIRANVRVRSISEGALLANAERSATVAEQLQNDGFADWLGTPDASAANISPEEL